MFLCGQFYSLIVFLFLVNGLILWTICEHFCFLHVHGDMDVELALCLMLYDPRDAVWTSFNEDGEAFILLMKEKSDWTQCSSQSCTDIAPNILSCKFLTTWPSAARFVKFSTKWIADKINLQLSSWIRISRGLKVSDVDNWKGEKWEEETMVFMDMSHQRLSDLKTKSSEWSNSEVPCQ